jgi:hypothetical protein
VDEREQGQQIPEGAKALHIRIAPHDDLEVRAVTGVIVNFSGEEFVITLFQGFPPAYRSTDDISDEIDGKVLFRALISPERWADVVETSTQQLAKLRENGLLPQRGMGKEER